MPLIATVKKLSSARQPSEVRRKRRAHSGATEEQRRASWYPISRWYVRPAAGWLARLLVPTPVRPVHLTACGLVVGLAACGILVWQPTWTPLAAALVLGAWFFDRVDGQLARQQNTASAFGAWLDGNVDELLDVGWHVAIAAALGRSGAVWPWLLVLAFVAGKYLFLHSLATEAHLGRETSASTPAGRGERAGIVRLARAAWHLPGNADLRLHLVLAALLTGCLAAELVLVAVYYNLRWIARFGLVARRLGGVR